MRPHTAAVCGKADHHIVDPPVGDEAKRFDKRRNPRHIVIDGLHEQRPLFCAELAKTRFRQGTVFHAQCIRPRIALLRYQARLDFLLARQPGELIGFERIAPRAPRIPNQQRPFLPMIAKEDIDIESAELHICSRLKWHRTDQSHRRAHVATNSIAIFYGASYIRRFEMAEYYQNSAVYRNERIRFMASTSAMS